MFEGIIEGIENVVEFFFPEEEIYTPESPISFSDTPLVPHEIAPEMIDIYEQMGYDVRTPRTYIEELDNFSPETCENPEAIIGDPEAAMVYWENQEGNTCALHAQRMIIEEITGVDIDIDAMQAVAEAYGWFDNGTPPSCVSKMLDYCGIPNEVMHCSGYEQLREMLANGDRVIAAVDADEYWFGEYDDLYNPDNANHAIEVIGIDESDPENPMVIINDTGVPNGCGLRVPADTFMEAWEDSSYHCVRVPVNDSRPLGTSYDSLSPNVELVSDEMLGYSAAYYKDQMAKALSNGNQIAYENAKKNWAKAAAK